MTDSARRPSVFGPEYWAEIGGAIWSHFDAWFALVAVNECHGDPSELRSVLEEQHRASLQHRPDAEAKLSHLADLTARLDQAGVDGSIPDR